MKTAAYASRVLATIALFSFSCLDAQTDTIVKRNGEVIACKITEVGTTGVSYKKVDFQNGPAFVDVKNDIRYIRFSNGQKQEFQKTADVPVMNNSVANNPPAGNNPTTAGPDTRSSENSKEGGAIDKKSSERGPISAEHKIIYDGRAYYVNGQKVRQKDVDRLLSRSTNPAVMIPYKTAKLTKTFQKITKFTSWPSTIAGGCGTVSGIFTLLKENAHGVPSASTWTSAGLSFLGTLTMPITAKILKKRQGKLYDKTIDLYNMGKM